jgi:hypothetical protein
MLDGKASAMPTAVKHWRPLDLDASDHNELKQTTMRVSNEDCQVRLRL